MTRFHSVSFVSRDTLWSVFGLLLCVIHLVSFCDAVDFGDLIANDEVTAKKWIRASAEFDNLMFPYKGILIQTLHDIDQNRSHLQLTNDCADSLASISHGLKNNQMWAYQFMDSSGKGKSGLTYGYISDLGNFDQCIGLNVRKEMTSNGKEFGGMYCMVNLKFPQTREPERNFLRVSLSVTFL